MFVFALLCLSAIQSCSVLDDEFSFSEPQYDIKTAEFSLEFKKLNKQLPVRVSYPVADTRFPVIVFSHGNGSKGDMYNCLLYTSPSPRD